LSAKNLIPTVFVIDLRDKNAQYLPNTHKKQEKHSIYNRKNTHKKQEKHLLKYDV